MATLEWSPGNGHRPSTSGKKMLKRIDMSIEDFDIIESNEAFAAQACAVSKSLGLDPEKGKSERRRHCPWPSNRRNRNHHRYQIGA